MSKTIQLSASLSTSQQVPPPHVNRGGSGTFTATATAPQGIPAGVEAGGWTMSYKLTWKRLSSPITSVDFHVGRPGKAGPTAKTLVCAPAITGPCMSGRLQTAELSDADELLRGIPMYIDVHTKKNPAGEIRGVIKVRR